MPAYPWLLRRSLNTSDIQARMKALKKLGVPYSSREIIDAGELLKVQAQEVAGRLKEQGNIGNAEDKEVTALIAYLQRLGRDALLDTIVVGGQP